MTYERRSDGWPLCPRCGEDELYSLLHWDGEGDRPEIQAWIDAGLCCYKCGWRSIDFVAGKPVPIPTIGSEIRERKYEDLPPH